MIYLLINTGVFISILPRTCDVLNVPFSSLHKLSLSEEYLCLFRLRPYSEVFVFYFVFCNCYEVSLCFAIACSICHREIKTSLSHNVKKKIPVARLIYIDDMMYYYNGGVVAFLGYGGCLDTSSCI